jgi:hypothetical protein
VAAYVICFPLNISQGKLLGGKARMGRNHKKEKRKRKWKNDNTVISHVDNSDFRRRGGRGIEVRRGMREEDFGERRGGYAGESGDCVGTHFAHSNFVNT